ncbi:hypothetical protein C8J57DRAFT_1249989 [Mycena rebaudengoi]|nr:hypothetical protein C8J57DRAFT_1249989 [Mycena rebaudengoi]
MVQYLRDSPNPEPAADQRNPLPIPYVVAVRLVLRPGSATILYDWCVPSPTHGLDGDLSTHGLDTGLFLFVPSGEQIHLAHSHHLHRPLPAAHLPACTSSSALRSTFSSCARSTCNIDVSAHANPEDPTPRPTRADPATAKDVRLPDLLTEDDVQRERYLGYSAMKQLAFDWMMGIPQISAVRGADESSEGDADAGEDFTAGYDAPCVHSHPRPCLSLRELPRHYQDPHIPDVESTPPLRVIRLSYHIHIATAHLRHHLGLGPPGAERAKRITGALHAISRSRTPYPRIRIAPSDSRLSTLRPTSLVFYTAPGPTALQYAPSPATRPTARSSHMRSIQSRGNATRRVGIAGNPTQQNLLAKGWSASNEQCRIE